MDKETTGATNPAAGKPIFAFAALALAVIGAALAFVPEAVVAAYVLAGIALVLGVFSIVKKQGKLIAIAAIVIALVGAVLAFTMQPESNGDTNSVDSDGTGQNVDQAGIDNTEAVLENDLQVILGQFAVMPNSDGEMKPSMAVTLVNISDAEASFTITIQAISSDGDVVAEDTLSTDNLGSEAEAQLTAFDDVGDDKIAPIRASTFKVSSAIKS